MHNDKARAAYLDIIKAHAARGSDDGDIRWEIENPKLIEFRRESGLPPIGWSQEHQMIIYYPDWMDYDIVYPRLDKNEADIIMRQMGKKIRETS